MQSTDNNGTCEVEVELSVTTKEVYESLGRLLEERQWIGSYSGVIGLDFYVTSQYTSLRRSALIYPKGGTLKGATGRRVDTAFCTNGLLDEVKDNGVSGNAIAHYEYIGGRVLKRTSRNGIALDLTTATVLTCYDPAGQPLQWKITGGNPGTPIALSFTHTYDNAGNKLTQNFNRDNRDDQTFTYESAARKFVVPASAGIVARAFPPAKMQGIRTETTHPPMHLR